MVKTESFNNAQSRVFCILACHQLSVSGNLDLKVTDQLLVWQGVETKFHFDVRRVSCHCNNCPNISRVSTSYSIVGMHEFPILSKIMFFKFRTLIDHILCSFELCLIVRAESSANQFRKKTNFPTMYKNFHRVIAKLVLI